MKDRETGPAFEDVTIGVIGAENFINRISAVARTEARAPYRLMAASDNTGAGVRGEALRIAENVDVLLFSGPLPYDLATSGGSLPVPATFIPTGGVALPTALLRGALSGTVDTARVSIDSVTTREVRETYSELGVEMTNVHVIEYHESVSPEQFLDFHVAGYEAGDTSGAITTVPWVTETLTEAGIPNLIMAPAPLTMRNALRTARLLGSGARMEDSRIAIVIVRLPASALPNRTSSSNFWFQELKLSLHRTLLHDARRMDAAVLQRDEQSFLIITTMGSLRAGTDDLQRAPFLANISNALGIEAEVGIGLGRTTVEAEEHAQAAVNRSAEQPGDRAFLIGPNGGPISLAASGAGPAPEQAPATTQHDRTLRSIVQALDAQGDANRVVDAERIAKLQGVTLRTARRTLHTLVDAGLAWPMPPARQQKVGRPPVRYQLLDERLES
ncbi:hypothetical protein [Pseudactinotalea sp. Z1748]|uniref:hypothetical protein n=1 Tax=Pseudactinotalea sp. Z1748 TaxID=3413027 RepID=UPI003C7ABF0C